jgi:hypothetical protein
VGLVGPAEDGEGQEAGGEPGVERVGLLGNLGGAAGGADGRGLAGDGNVAVVAMPGGDAVAPPELAGDAPVVDVVHPLEVGLRVHLGGEADRAVRIRWALDGGDGLGSDGVSTGGGRFIDGHEPLHGEARLDDGAGALADGDRHGMAFDGYQEAGGFKVGDDPLAGGEAVETVIGGAGEINVGRRVEDVGLGKVVALADGEVVGVVGGGDLDGAGSELGLGPLVGEEGDVALRCFADLRQRKDEELPEQIHVAFVGGIHDDGYVAEHGLGAGGGDDH